MTTRTKSGVAGVSPLVTSLPKPLLLALYSPHLCPLHPINMGTVVLIVWARSPPPKESKSHADPSPGLIPATKRIAFMTSNNFF